MNYAPAVISNTEKPRVSVDFQDHLKQLEAHNLVTRIDHPINKDTELHPLVRLQFIGDLAESERRAFLFTNVVDGTGNRFDIPVVVGAFAASPEIYAQGMGCAVGEIGAAWLKAIRNPIAPVQVPSGECQDIVMTGDALRGANGGLKKLPIPISTPGFDSAPYLTATLCVTKDPESGIQNMGTYRAGLKATDRIAMRMVVGENGAGGYKHWRKYKALGQKMPIAIVVGVPPVVMFTGPQKLPIDVDEMGVAGALAGQPIRIVKCKTIDLEVPAAAEIVIEGLIDTDLLEPEAPFGESNGYVALEAFNMVMEVTAITHRQSPMFASIISQVTPSESSMVKKVAYEPLWLNHLKENLNVRGVRRVVMHEPLTNLRPVIFVQYAPGTPRSEVWRGLHGASTLMADCGKICIAVSEDIEPSNTDAVFWSLAYRCNPAEDVHIAPYRGAVQGAQYGSRASDSSLLIDATIKGVMPPLALPKKEYMERAQALWTELKLPPVKLKTPWHGYTLGKWTENWELFAQRATRGEWEKNGDATKPRQRGGLTPETMVWRVEKDIDIKE
jgi:4-hydroxy-3-polyprenylbenzoate decarboxylase